MVAATDSLTFNCAGCGKPVRARLNQGGRVFACPGCGGQVQVPKVALVSGSEPKAQQTAVPVQLPGTDLHPASHAIRPPSAPGSRWFKVPSTIGELLRMIALSWLATSLLLFIVGLFSTLLGYLCLLLWLTATCGCVYQGYLVMRARQRVLAEKDIPLLWGFVRLIAWDPVEGVLFLRNKSMGFYDDSLHDGCGGVRLIYPILGDELALRIPLEVQTLQFFDQNVMTREYLSVTVHGTLKWRITDIRKFYLLLSRELRNTSDLKRVDGVGYVTAPDDPAAVADEKEVQVSVQKKLNLAIMWLRVLTEEQTRTVVSRVSSGLLIADRLADEVPEIKAAVTRDRSMLAALAADAPRTAAGEWCGAADGLARSIYDTLGHRVASYGISLDEVSLQEVRLPEEVVKSCVEAAQTAYLPLVAQRKAAAEVAVKRANLSTEVELLGRETVGMREVAGAAPGFTLVDFLSNYLSKGLNAQAAAALAATATAATMGSPAQFPNHSRAATPAITAADNGSPLVGQ